ncbi:MAG: type II toxin-antitoxin system RelE/ParE family toxin [Gammaproteobacteria bacterium]
MATVVYSAAVLAGLEQILGLMAQGNAGLATATASVISSAIDTLAEHPLLGPRVHGDIRALLISRGRTGHIALYRYRVLQDEVRVLAIRTQREMGFVP